MSESLIYQIRIQGHLDETWISWFAPLSIVNESNGEATLIGIVRDQAELHGLLNTIFDLNMALLSLNRIPDSAPNV